MDSLRDTRIPESACPFCAYVMDGAMAAASNPDSAPEPGALGVCMNCASILFFDDALHLRPAAKGEIEAIFRTDAPFAEQVRHMQRVIRSLDRKRA